MYKGGYRIYHQISIHSGYRISINIYIQVDIGYLDIYRWIQDIQIYIVVYNICHKISRYKYRSIQVILSNIWIYVYRWIQDISSNIQLYIQVDIRYPNIYKWIQDIFKYLDIYRSIQDILSNIWIYIGGYIDIQIYKTIKDISSNITIYIGRYRIYYQISRHKQVDIGYIDIQVDIGYLDICIGGYKHQ